MFILALFTDRGVLRDHLGCQKGADIRDAYRCTVLRIAFNVLYYHRAVPITVGRHAGGAAIMRQGPNLLKLARKEQCLALLSQLRNKFKTDGQFYRVFPNGEVQYLHPKDGVYPEKVNKGREAVGSVDRRIGANPNPINVSCSVPAATTAACWQLV